MKEARLAIYAAAEAQQSQHRHSEERPCQPGGLRPRTPQDADAVKVKLEELISEVKNYPAFARLLEKVRVPMFLSPFGADRWVGVKSEYCKLTMFCGGYTVISPSREISVDDAAKQLAASGVNAEELEQIWNLRTSQFVNADLP